MAKILGIDLGTTNAAMAIVEGGEPRVLENAEGARTTPSIVAVGKNGERIVGTLAKRQSVTNPLNTIFQIKRFIGHTFDEPGVQKDIKSLPFEVRKSTNGGIEVKMADKWYRPEEISAMILQKIKADAEARLGGPVTEAVISEPPAEAAVASETEAIPEAEAAPETPTEPQEPPAQPIWPSAEEAPAEPSEETAPET